jgi:hypothetical protein
VRTKALAERAASAARALPQGRRQAIILAGMTGYYLSHPAASAPDVLPIAMNVRAAIGGLMAPTLCVFKVRGLVGRLSELEGLRTRLVVPTTEG